MLYTSTRPVVAHMHAIPGQTLNNHPMGANTNATTIVRTCDRRRTSLPLTVPGTVNQPLGQTQHFKHQGHGVRVS